MDAATTELTDASIVKSCTTRQISCSTPTGITDPVQVTTTGGTSLRHDTSSLRDHDDARRHRRHSPVQAQ